MRDYGQIQCAFWQSPDIQRLSDVGKLLASYLLTGPHSNGLGVYRLPDGYVMADLGWTSETVSKGLQELSRNCFAYRFDNVVLMPNFLRWNPVANPNSAKAREREFDLLPNGNAKTFAAQSIRAFPRHFRPEFLNRIETVAKRLQEGLLKPYAEQEQEQEQEQLKAPYQEGNSLGITLIGGRNA